MVHIIELYMENLAAAAAAHKQPEQLQWVYYLFNQSCFITLFLLCLFFFLAVLQQEMLHHYLRVKYSLRRILLNVADMQFYPRFMCVLWNQRALFILHVWSPLDCCFSHNFLSSFKYSFPSDAVVTQRSVWSLWELHFLNVSVRKTF